MALKLVLAAPLIEVLTGAVLRAKTGGDKAKIVARAEELQTILAAVKKINGGDTGGVSDLEQAVLNLQTLDPAEALAVQNLAGLIANKSAAIAQLTGDTILGQAATELLDAVGDIMGQTCQAYITKYGTPAVPAAAS